MKDHVNIYLRYVEKNKHLRKKCFFSVFILFLVVVFTPIYGLQPFTLTNQESKNDPHFIVATVKKGKWNN